MIFLQMIQLILNAFLVPVYERILNDREPDLSLRDPGVRFKNQAWFQETRLNPQTSRLECQLQDCDSGNHLELQKTNLEIRRPRREIHRPGLVNQT